MKVLTVGDSFTYGAELRQPEQTAWPALLAQKNNWEVNNQGKGGGSNDRIIRVVFEEISNNYDLIIVAWTSWDRFEIKNGDVSIWAANNQRLLVGDCSWAKDYYKHGYDDFFAFSNYIRQIILLQSYFNQRGQRYLFCNAFDTPTAYIEQDKPGVKELVNQVDLTYFIDWPNGHMCEWIGYCPKGPGGHPLELGHQRIAERINEYIRHLDWIS
jgi:hypothetical protein